MEYNNLVKSYKSYLRQKLHESDVPSADKVDHWRLKDIEALMNRGYTRREAAAAVAGPPPAKTYIPTGGETPQPSSLGQVVKNVWDGSQVGQIVGAAAKAYDWATKPTTPPNPNAGFVGVPDTISFYDALVAREGGGVGGEDKATKAIDSARDYQLKHPNDLPSNFRQYIPTYSTDDVNRQHPIAIREPWHHLNKMGDRAAAYYDPKEGKIVVQPMFVGSMATGPTTAKNLMPSLAVHELTHAISPTFSAYRREHEGRPWWHGGRGSKMEKLVNPQAEQDRALIDDNIKNEPLLHKNGTVTHDQRPDEFFNEVSDAKLAFSKSTGKSTIMTTPEEQKAFKDWSYSPANPRAVKQKDGSYVPAVNSLWPQMNKFTPKQQSDILGSIVKGKTPQQPTSTTYGNYHDTPYSQQA